MTDSVDLTHNDRFNMTQGNEGPMKLLDGLEQSPFSAVTAQAKLSMLAAKNDSQDFKKLYEPSSMKSIIKVEDVQQTIPKNRQDLRKQNPTFGGFMASTTIDPRKQGIDNKPAIVEGV